MSHKTIEELEKEIEDLQFIIFDAACSGDLISKGSPSRVDRFKNIKNIDIRYNTVRKLINLGSHGIMSFVKDPDEDLQLYAIGKSLNNIYKIKKPTNKVQVEVAKLETHGYYTQLRKPICQEAQEILAKKAAFDESYAKKTLNAKNFKLYLKYKACKDLIE